MYDDTQRYLNKAEELAPSYSLQIMAKGKVKARLYGEDQASLQARAHQYIKAVGLASAEVVPS